MEDKDKTIAIVGSCDTKYQEIGFMRNWIEKQGLKVLVLNVATGALDSRGYDISREEIVEIHGKSWSELVNKTKGEKISFMTEAVAQYVEILYKKGKIQGILAVGGLQNTVMATTAMKRLPIGFPKVMATTIASGSRCFETVVGDKDVVCIPSICDFTGINVVTKQIIANACACCSGMVKFAGNIFQKEDKPIIGVSLMGVTNNGAVSAISTLEKYGYEVIGFHATGVGGAIMEKIAQDGIIDGILDLTLHEITSEYFGGGFSYGKRAETRLRTSIRKKIPLVVCPGGLDFVDYDRKEFPSRMEQRKVYMHNKETGHIKILPDEAEQIVKIIVERLNEADYPIKFLYPTDGMRHNTKNKEELYDKEVDNILIQGILQNTNENIQKVKIEGNLDTEEWGRQAALEMIALMKEREESNESR